METSGHQSSTGLHPHEGAAESTSWWHNHLSPKGVDTQANANRPERHGHFSGTDKRTRDLREVECYTCRKKGHLSCNCPQHTWNKPHESRNWTPRPSQGREVIVDDRSVCDEEPPSIARSSTQTPQQQADSWL